MSAPETFVLAGIIVGVCILITVSILGVMNDRRLVRESKAFDKILNDACDEIHKAKREGRNPIIVIKKP